MINPGLEMRRLAGSIAFLFAGIYLLVLFAAILSTAIGERLPLLGWPLLLIPGAAFVPSVIDAVHLHRTTDLARMKALWPRCLLCAVIGMALLVAAAIMVEEMT